MANIISNGGDIRLGMIEVRPYRPFKTSEEYLWAMKEDLAEWLTGLYSLNITAETFCEVLETGTILCSHANKVRRMALEYLSGSKDGGDGDAKLRQHRNRLPFPVPSKEVIYRENVHPGTFPARDNVSNFISWCRALNILECLLFETDDLVLRKNEKSFILCLLEVARRGSKVGMPTPLLVQMEEEIDREIARDNAKRMRDSGVETDAWTWPPEVDLEPQKQIITNDLKSLDEMVRDLVNRCTCPVQFPMIRISEGKYRIGDTKILIFVRILRNHVMVRVGGGWDTLAHYLDKHDPCRCRQGHRTTISSKLTVKYPTNPSSTNINSQTHLMVDYLRTPDMSPVSPPIGQPLTSSPRNRSVSPVHNSSLQPLPGSRQRRSSASSTTSSHEHSTESSSIAGEPILNNSSKVGSYDSAYCSSPSMQRKAIIDSNCKSSAKSNGTNTSDVVNSSDVADFSKHIPLTSTPKSKPDSVNGTPKSRIPTSDINVRKKNSTSVSVRNGHVFDTSSLGRPAKNGANVANGKRVSSSFEPRMIPRSHSHMDDMHLGLSGSMNRSQDVRRSYRLPRSPSSQWTPNGAGTMNGLNNHSNNDRNRTWSGFRPGNRTRPSISPDTYENRTSYATNNNHHPPINGTNNKKVLNHHQNFSSPRFCPTLLQELMCDPSIDSNQKLLEKMEKIVAANCKRDSTTDAILTEDLDEDYTKRWVTDTADNYSKAVSPGMVSPDYGHDFETLAISNAQLSRIKKPIASPRKNNHPLTETKIPMPIY